MRDVSQSGSRSRPRTWVVIEQANIRACLKRRYRLFGTISTFQAARMAPLSHRFRCPREIQVPTRWCCFASSSFGRCSGWRYFTHVFCWVVLLCTNKKGKMEKTTKIKERKNCKKKRKEKQKKKASKRTCAENGFLTPRNRSIWAVFRRQFLQPLFLTNFDPQKKRERQRKKKRRTKKRKKRKT